MEGPDSRAFAFGKLAVKAPSPSNRYVHQPTSPRKGVGCKEDGAGDREGGCKRIAKRAPGIPERTLLGWGDSFLLVCPRPEASNQSDYASLRVDRIEEGAMSITTKSRTIGKLSDLFGRPDDKIKQALLILADAVERLSIHVQKNPGDAEKLDSEVRRRIRDLRNLLS